ncbi:uncharacterized protein TNCV_3013921 [Trichonephila clavipes]|nr:uncharacterized protein TNCV_3013921 [Trichonephila clavipes]
MKRTLHFLTFQHVKKAKYGFEDDPTPTIVKCQRTMKKVIYAVFFRSTGLIKAIKFEGQKTVIANSYTTKCLPEIFQEVNVRGLMLHHDSASSHTARLTAEFLKQKQIKVIEHPPYSPDLAICDFWLLFNLKRNLRGRRFSSEEDIDVAINAFFLSIQRNEWFQAFNLRRKFGYKSTLMCRRRLLGTLLKFC